MLEQNILQVYSVEDGSIVIAHGEFVDISTPVNISYISIPVDDAIKMAKVILSEFGE